MKVTVKLLGMLRKDRFKQQDFDIPEGTSAGNLLNELSVHLEEMKVCIITINGEKSGPDTVLKGGDELMAFLPFGEG